MTKLKLRGLGPPRNDQLKIIDYIMQHSRTVKPVHVCAGRGWGKSDFAIILALKTMINYPGIVGLFLEPDLGRINKVFLHKWYTTVDPSCYTINKSDRRIELDNGSVLFYAPRHVTGNKDMAADAERGPSLGFVIDDEAGIGANLSMYQNTLPAIRGDWPIKYYLTISTFRYGDYELIIDNPADNNRVFYGRTSDNIRPLGYLDPEYEQTLRSTMPDDIAALELDSKRGRPQGQIWSPFIWERFPAGNLLEGYSYQFGKPWYLVLDLGNHGAAQIYQTPDPCDPVTGARYDMRGKLWCCVEEWLYNNDRASNGHVGFENHLHDIIDRYCDGDPDRHPPVCVYAGHDISTRDATSGKSAKGLFDQLGWSYSFVSGPVLGSKDLQRTHTSRMMHERRFVVAANRTDDRWHIARQHLGHSKKRGILECLLRDVYPDEKGQVFIKDKKSNNPVASIEDDRDCMMYGAVKFRHPSTYDADIYKGT